MRLNDLKGYCLHNDVIAQSNGEAPGTNHVDVNSTTHPGQGIMIRGDKAYIEKVSADLDFASKSDPDILPIKLSAYSVESTSENRGGALRRSPTRGPSMAT